MKKTRILSIACLAIAFASCSKSSDNSGGDGGGTNTGAGKYIIAAYPTGAVTGTADYLLTADDVSTGTISTKGNGVEQDGTYRYYLTTNNKFFSMLYGQGNPGAVTTYSLASSGNLEKTSNFQTETVQVFAPYNNDIILFKVPRSGDANSLIYRIDAASSTIAGQYQLNIETVAGNGERAHFTWATQFGDKILAPYMSIRGVTGNVFGTAFPDSSWVAVLSYPDMKLEKVIRDNRTSYLGAYFTNGLFVDEQGDAYGFSGADASDAGTITSTKPSAIVRIKKGTTEFDQSYFFNFQEKTGGYHIDAAKYISNGKFLVQTYEGPNVFTGVKFAIADVYTQTFQWVVGAPTDITSSTISRYGTNSLDGNQALLGITTSDGSSYVYSFDANTATAKRGLKVDGGTITAVHYLKY